MLIFLLQFTLVGLVTLCVSLKVWFRICLYFYLRVALVTCIYLTQMINISSAFALQALAYLNVAAVGAAAQSAAFAKSGQTKLQWMVICNMYGKFCNQIGEGIAVSLLASICMVGLSCISAFGLFRLYGSNKAKDNSGW